MENVNANCNHADMPLEEGDKVCVGCKAAILDPFHLHVAPDMDWHAACLVCIECSKPLDETCSCLLHEGQPYCRTDYIRLFGLACSVCSEQIAGSDLIMRANSQIFHPRCFCCSACERRLLPGEQFVLSTGQLFCLPDFEALPVEAPASPSEAVNGNDGRLISESSSYSSSSTTTTTTTVSRAKRSNSEKGPRVRTVLSEQQLQTLRTVYSSNPRPDALLKEHLVEITGLSPRVIRVWFQNKRCKDKKKAIQVEALRLQQQQQQALGTGKVMPPLTPQPPLTPDSMGQMSPHTGLSAFTYPPPPSSYEQLSGLPTTPTQVSVSPMVPYGHGSAWGSPTEHSVSPFEGPTDFSSPMTTEHPQSFVYSSASTVHSPYF